LPVSKYDSSWYFCGIWGLAAGYSAAALWGLAAGDLGTACN